jgi:Na+/melibiose symporter-like transporter
MAQRDRPGWVTLLSYASPSLPLAGLGLPLVVHLPTYYAREIGLPLAAIGTAFLMVRLIDIFFDPLIGWAMDRTRTRLGRFRPWLIAATPILMVAAAMLFFARPGAPLGYLWLWLLVGYAGFSMASLSQTAWGAVLSPEYNQRSRIYGFWQAGNVIGMLLVLALPPLLELGFKAPHATGIHAMGWFIIILMPLTVALAAWRVGEPVKASAVAHKGGLKDYLGLFRFPAVRNLLVADLLLGWAPAITGTLFLFYFDQIKGVPEAKAGLYLLVYFIAGLLGAPLWTALALKVGKHKALALVCAVIVLSLLVMMVTPFSSLGLGIGIMLLGGLPFSGGALLLRAMLADVGDEVRLVTGVDRTGLLYSIFTGTRKIADMLAILTFLVLARLGFDPNTAGNSAQSLLGLQVLFIGLPSLLAVAAALVVLRYPLDARRHAEIRAALDARASAEALA